MAWTSFILTTSPVDVVAALRAACENTDHWNPLKEDEIHTHGCGMDACLLANYCGHGFTGKDLGLCACVWQDGLDRVLVTMHAVRWENDRSLPCDEEYARAEDLATPLLAAAGKLLGRRLRLSRPPPDRVRPLRGLLANPLTRVTAVYERTAHPKLKVRELHPNDEKEFWRFIRIAHQHASTLRPSDVACHLRAAGFHSELVSRLEHDYEVGRQVLAFYEYPWDLRRDWKKRRQRRSAESEAERARFMAISKEGRDCD